MKPEMPRPLPLATTAAFTPGMRLPQHKAAAWAQAVVHARQTADSRQALGSPQTVDAGQAQASAVARPTGPMPFRAATAASASSRPSGCAATDQGRLSAVLLERWTGEGDPVPGSDRHAATPAGGLPLFQSRPGASASALTSTDPASSPSQPPLVRGQADAAAIRIHVEQRPGAVAVWLGVDAQVGGERIAAIVQDLKQQRRGALPVATIVCNGRTVFDRASFSKETS